LIGDYQQNSRLSTTERLSLGTGFGPEGVAIDSSGKIFAGIEDGRIIRLLANGTQPEVVADTHGRPLGLIFDPNGNLVVADAKKGLLSISLDGTVNRLVTEAGGIPLHCSNDLDLATDGTVYFTDASKFPLSMFKADLLEHQSSGRLIAYDLQRKSTRVLLPHLSFANGVAISPDQSFVLAVETGNYRVDRFWLKGPKQGQSDVFIDNLPGFPDGISSNGKGKFWLALVSPRDPLFDKLMPYPWLRKVVLRLPESLQPAPKRYGFVLGLDMNGRVVDNLQDGSTDCYAEIAKAVEHQGKLYFGSIGESAVGRFTIR